MPKVRTGDQALVRELNLSIILNVLREKSPRSRAAIAAATGLNKTTVSSLVQQLIDAGFVCESGTGKKDDIGRPGIMLELDPKAGRIIGAEIGVDFISVILTDFAAEIIWRHQISTTGLAGQSAILARALDTVAAAVNHSHRDGCDVLGLGLGVPGLVDEASGTLLFAPNLHWENVPLRRMLEARFAFPVYVGNEANMAALGESYFGVARGARQVLYISAGVGLGGGIVLDGEMLSGATGFAGEVGHMTVVPDGSRCNCGNIGCWETMVSQWALFRRLRAAITAGENSLLLDYTQGELAALTMPLVVQAARAGDGVTLRALDETALYLGVGMANLINALNPDVVVFGGILSLAGEFLMPTLRRVITARALRWPAAAARVLVATHGFDACAMGGIAKVYHQILSRPVEAARSSHERSPIVAAAPGRAAFSPIR